MRTLRLGAFVLALALLLGVAGYHSPVMAVDRKLLYRTHVDAAHLAWEDGALAMKVIDGATPVSPDSVYVRLGPDADRSGKEVSRIRVPDKPGYSFLGKPGDIVWSAPQALLDDHAPVWPGFGVGTFPEELLRTVRPETTRIELVSVSGPGDMHVYSASVSRPNVMFSSVGTAHRAQYMAPGSHGHFSWAFSKPGRYDLTWRGSVTNRDGTVLSSPPAVVSWLVGPDEAVGLPAGTTKANPIKTPVDAAPSPSASPTATPSASASPSASPTTAPTGPAYNPTKGAECVHYDAGSLKIASAWASGSAGSGVPSPTVTVTGGDGTQLKKYRSVINIPESALTSVPTASALNRYLPAGGNAYHVPNSLTLDTSGIDFGPLFEATTVVDYAEAGSDDAVFAVTSGSGADLVTDLQSVDPPRSTLRYSAPRTTSHDLWFSKPGFYAVDLSTHVKLKELKGGLSQQNYDDATLWFAVGNEAIASACKNANTTPTPTPTPKPTPTPTVQPTPTAQPTQPSDSAQVWLADGHTDIFHVTASGDKLGLDLREDITGSHVVRDPERVGLRVKEQALVDLPDGVPGAPRGYLLPLTQDPALLWPGWDTNAVAAAGIGRVDIQVLSVSGPGTVHVFSLDMLGSVSSLLADGGTSLPGTIVAAQPSHTHANWVFTAPGDYTMSVQASATKDGKRLESPVRTYTWKVGDGGAQPTATPTPTSSGMPTAVPSSNASAPAVPAEQAPPAADALKAAATRGALSQAACRPVSVSAGAKQQVATQGHFDLGAQMVDGALVPLLKDDRSTPAVWASPNATVFQLGDKAKHTAPAALSFVTQPGKPIWMIGATQADGVPWLGQNTMHPTIINETTGPVTWRLVRVSGPGKFALFQSGALGGGVGQRLADNVGGPTVHTIPANTHAHPNWVFTEPGQYTLTFAMSARSKAGKDIGGTTQLSFAVGVPAAPTSTATTTIVGRTLDGKSCDLPDGARGRVTAAASLKAPSADEAAAPVEASDLPVIEAASRASSAPQDGEPAPVAAVTWPWLLAGVGIGVLGGAAGGVGGALAVLARVRRT